ncbi:EamA family transporter [Vineibacter terrae]|uniref:EamA family transporter n=1 Tax=Vineibacter terrae TaxID=2586908 RepID=A0A5C8PA88_9HYPH|nr:EamA family transporter [Vineibacter terrae]TXL70674.1 EamA family transporter [Vineibacter terrae]
MPPTHIVLALIVAVIWGFNFAAIRIGLESFPPLLLTGLRFLIAAVPVLWLARPAVSWPLMLAIAGSWYVAQFALLFSAMAAGLAPGIAAVLDHMQAPFTILFALAIGERPTRRQVAGMLTALAGLGLVGLSIGGDVTATGFVLAVGAGASWALGNVIYKRVRAVEMSPMIAWLSLVAALPSLGLSAAAEGPMRVLAALASASWAGWVALAYLGIAATLLAWWMWAYLLARHPASTVAPFALLVPVISAVVSFLAFGERFGPLRFSGMALIVGGLAIVALPLHTIWQRLHGATGPR